MGFGHAFEILTSVPDLGEAVLFYERLGFRWAFGGRPTVTTEWATDGRVTIVLTEGPPAPGRLVILTESIDLAAARVEAAGPEIRRHPGSRWFSFNDPGGLSVSVVEAEPDEVIPRPGDPPSLLGPFGEVSVLAPGLEPSRAFWSRLGFEPTPGPGPPPPGGPGRSLSMTDGVLPIGFREADGGLRPFRSPALLYADPEMPGRLRGLREAGWTLVESADFPEVATLEAPGGQLFLLALAGGDRPPA